ncbi:mannose-6-phosphate isomerase [Entophlyctis helioformis]|nr:mannose-6-phosphate isomerase [Entophlyctis helioformis]
MTQFARIAAKTQSYDWGKIGRSSTVATLAAATPGFSIDDTKPYAELWMGTHPNAPSVLVDSQTPLRDVLTPSNLSPDLHKHYNGDLPFLFKVLSINKALSIQAHPDKALAQQLFTKYPHLYKDPNHKPEMALALTPFEAFIGFRPLAEISGHLDKYPEFAAVIGTTVASAFKAQVAKTGASTGQDDLAANKQALRTLFGTLMNQDPAVIATQLDALIARVAHSPDTLDKLLVRLNKEYPQDVGCFCALLLNYLTLSAGDAIFLAANEPHAYISGDCVECMATSDNVVRSGLTPKFKDVDTLVSMLTYNYGPADAQILRGDPVPNTSFTRLYDPPIDEFSVARVHFARGQTAGALVEHAAPLKGPSIALVTAGSGYITVNGSRTKAESGFVFFIGADVPVTYELPAEGSDFTVYRAYCQL